MSNHQIADCCVAAIHERLIDMLDLKDGLSNVTNLSCNHCAKCYRLSVFRREPLGTEINGTGYHAIYEDIVDVSWQDEVQSGFQAFVIPAQPKHYGSFKFVYNREEPEKLGELQEQIYESIKHNYLR